MLRALHLSLCLAVFYLCFCGLPSTASSGFEDALAAQKQNRLQEARDLWMDVLKSDPRNPKIHYNLALLDLSEKKLGWAKARLRQSLILDPQFEEAQEALKNLTKKTPSSSTKGWIDPMRSWVLSGISLNSVLFLSALVSFGLGWTWLGFIQNRRIAKRTRELPPSWPWVGSFFALSSVLFIFLASLKSFELNQLRGTILEGPTSAKLAPSQSQVDLFELIEGQEVVVLDRKDDWVQVKSSAGESGWIPKSVIFEIDSRSQLLRSLPQL